VIDPRICRNPSDVWIKRDRACQELFANLEQISEIDIERTCESGQQANLVGSGSRSREVVLASGVVRVNTLTEG